MIIAREVSDYDNSQRSEWLQVMIVEKKVMMIIAREVSDYDNSQRSE